MVIRSRRNSMLATPTLKLMLRCYDVATPTLTLTMKNVTRVNGPGHCHWHQDKVGCNSLWVTTMEMSMVHPEHYEVSTNYYLTIFCIKLQICLSKIAMQPLFNGNGNGVRDISKGILSVVSMARVRALFLKIAINLQNVTVFCLQQWMPDGHWWRQSPEAMKVVAGEDKKPLFPPKEDIVIYSSKNENCFLINELIHWECHGYYDYQW